MFQRLKNLSLTQWIFVGLFLGLIIGNWVPQVIPYIRPFRGLFINGIKSIIAPLVFSAMVTGVANAGNFKVLGRMGLRTIIYFEVVTTFALAIGLIVVNVLKPGSGLHIVAEPPGIIPEAITQKITLAGFIENLLPSNFIDAVAKGNVLQIVIFSTVFAIAALAIGEKAKPILRFCEALTSVMFKFTGYIMYLAPFAIGAAIASSVQEHGFKVMIPLLRLVGSLYLSLVLFILIILVPICIFFKIPIKKFAKYAKDAVLLAFATTSSESAYPAALKSMEDFGVPRRITSFVLPVGYSFNLDGSTLYLAMASIFIAQAANINLPLSQQLLMMVTLMFTSKGVAAVPRASLIVLMGTLTSFGLPLKGVALIIGVDELMDMGRTAVNLLGNCLATAVIARIEGIPL